jgi:hypothetical protein
MFRNLRTLRQAAVAACVLVGWAGTGMAGAQSACAHLGGTVDPDQIYHARSAGSGYEIDFRFPVNYPDQRALADYLTGERDRLGSWVAQNTPGPVRHARSYELVANGTAYRSGTPASGTETVGF